MKKALVLVAIALAAAGALFLVFGEYSPRGDFPRAQRVWPEYDPQGIRSLAVRSSAGAYLLERQGDGWVLRFGSSPVAPLADPAKVGALLDFLVHNKPILRVVKGGGAAAGLGPNAAMLTVNGDDILEFGVEDEARMGVYARRGGDGDVVLLAREYADILARKAEFYLDLRLLDSKPENVEAVIVARQDESWEVDRNKQGLVFVRPEALIPMRVGAEAFELWLHEVLLLRASGLALEKPDPGRKPDVTASLRLKIPSGEHQTLRLFAPGTEGEPWVALSSRQAVFFLLDPGQANKVDKKAFSLIDRRLAALDPGAVDRLVLSASGRALRAKRDGTGWGNELPSAQLTGIDMFLWRLTDLQYEYGPVGALPATAEERMRLELFSKNDDGLLDLVFYADTGLPSGQCWVARGMEQGFYPVADQIYKDLQGLLPPVPEGGVIK